jgi:hypothetical protein
MWLRRPYSATEEANSEVALTKSRLDEPTGWKRHPQNVSSIDSIVESFIGAETAMMATGISCKTKLRSWLSLVVAGR